jgi:hypothetical protein
MLSNGGGSILRFDAPKPLAPNRVRRLGLHLGSAGAGIMGSGWGAGGLQLSAAKVHVDVEESQTA